MNKFFTAIALVMGLILYFSFSWGFIFYKFWYWFVLDVFPELPKITIYQAVGLKIFAGILNTLRNPTFREDLYKEGKVTRTVEAVIMPWIVLGSGYLIYLFIS